MILYFWKPIEVLLIKLTSIYTKALLQKGNCEFVKFIMLPVEITGNKHDNSNYKINVFLKYGHYLQIVPPALKGMEGITF